MRSSNEFEHIRRMIFPTKNDAQRDNEFPFRILSELVDNASDAGARKLKIYNVVTKKNGNLLHFQDDGDGMEPLELVSAVFSGFSTKREKKTAIGKFGYGLKAPLYIYNDILIYTKKNNYASIALMSEFEGSVIKTGIVSFEIINGEFFDRLDLTEGESVGNKRHVSNLNFIMKYSPFNTKQSLLNHFFKIEKNGTTVILFNCKQNIPHMKNQCFLTYCEDIADILTKDSYNELNFVLDTARPIMADDYVSARSFRKYLSVLYKHPRMVIYISDSKIETMILETKLCYGKSYTYRTKLFNNQLKEIIVSAIEEHAQDVKALEEYTEIFNELNDNFNPDITDSVIRINYLLANIVRLKEKINREVNFINNAIKEVNTANTLVIKFGLNLYDPEKSASVVYCNGRLVKIIPSLKLTQQIHDKYEHKGIVAIIDIPFSVHDKKRFAESDELQQFEAIVSHYRDSFIKETRTDLARASYKEFWEYHGFGEKRSESHETYRQRCKQKMSKVIQCEICLRWRTIKGDDDQNHTCFSENQIPCDHHEQLVQFGRGKHMIPEAFDLRDLLDAEIDPNDEVINKFRQRIRNVKPASKSNTDLSSSLTNFAKRKGVPRRCPESTTRFTQRDDFEKIKKYSSVDFMKKSYMIPKDSNTEYSFSLIVERLRSLLNKVSGSSEMPFEKMDNVGLIHFNFEKYILDKIGLLEYPSKSRLPVSGQEKDKEEISNRKPEVISQPRIEGNIVKAPLSVVVQSQIPVKSRPTTSNVPKDLIRKEKTVRNILNRLDEQSSFPVEQSTDRAKSPLKKLYQLISQTEISSVVTSNVTEKPDDESSEQYSDTPINILMPSDDDDEIVEITKEARAVEDDELKQTRTKTLPAQSSTIAQDRQQQQITRTAHTINVTEALSRAQPHPLFRNQLQSPVQSSNFLMRRSIFNPFIRDESNWSSLNQGETYHDAYTNIKFKKDPGIPQPNVTFLNPILVDSRSSSPTISTEDSKKRSSSKKCQSPDYNYHGDYLIPKVKLTLLTDEELDSALKKSKTSASPQSFKQTLKDPPKLINPYELRAQSKKREKPDQPPKLKRFGFKEPKACSSTNVCIDILDEDIDSRIRRSKDSSDEEFDPKMERAKHSRTRKEKK